MELVALLSNREEILIPRLKDALRKYTLYPLRTPDELENLISNIPLDLFIIDEVSYQLSSLTHFLERLDDDTVVMITEEKPDNLVTNSLPRSVYECVPSESIMTDLSVVVDRAIEQQRMKTDVNYEKGLNRDIYARMLNSIRSDVESEDDISFGVAGSDSTLMEKSLISFANVVATNCDMTILLDRFFDSVMKIVSVRKMTLMLRGNNGFDIRKQCGFDTYALDAMVPGKESALVAWLEKTGHIMHKRDTYDDSISDDIKREMELLESTLTFPLIYRDRLIGMFHVGQKDTKEPFYKRELNIIQAFCTFLSIAVRDCEVCKNVWYRERLTEYLLARNCNGIIAVDESGKVTLCNQQALNILSYHDELTGSDVEKLPSALRDIIHDTMTEGRTVTNHELTLLPAHKSLVVDSFTLLDERQKIIGAGILFTDDQKPRMTDDCRIIPEEISSMHQLIAKIAHEIRNPLTSIQTYTQLLNEKSDHDELNNFFLSSVTQSIHRLDVLIDKLAAFSISQDYHFRREDINNIMRETADFITRNIPQSHKFFKQLLETKSYAIHVDKKQFIRAIYYLVLSIIDETAEGTFITLTAGMTIDESPSAQMALTYGGDASLVPDDLTAVNLLSDSDNLGSGLNIPISRKIIEGHNGSLEIRSDSGINVFVIKLPLLEEIDNSDLDKGGTGIEQ